MIWQQALSEAERSLCTHVAENDSVRFEEVDSTLAQSILDLALLRMDRENGSYVVNGLYLNQFFQNRG